MRRFLFIVIAALILLEVAARFGMRQFANDWGAVFYGIDPRVRVHVHDVSQQRAYVYTDGVPRTTALPAREGVTRALAMGRDDGRRPFVAWAFGDGATGGFYCTDDSSSWAHELVLIAGGVIRNFARAGSDSVFAARTLAGALHIGRPDLVFWTASTGDLATPSEVQRWHTAVREKSLAYELIAVTVEHAFERIAGARDREVPRNIDEATLDMALARFNARLESVFALAEQFDFQVALMSLPARGPAEGWSRAVHERMVNFANHPRSVLIDIRHADETNYCDDRHQTRDGHKATAARLWTAIQETDLRYAPRPLEE